MNSKDAPTTEQQIIGRLSDRDMWKLEQEATNNCPRSPKTKMAWAIFDRRGKLVAIGFSNKMRLWKSLGEEIYPDLDKAERIRYLKDAGFRCFRVFISPPTK